MTEHDGCVVLAEGNWGYVLGVRVAGVSKALDWLQQLPVRQEAAMRPRLDRLAGVGWLKSPDSFRQLSNDGAPVVYEVKHVGQNLRLYVIKGDRAFYATHGGVKPKKNRVASEIAKARSIYQGRDRA